MDSDSDYEDIGSISCQETESQTENFTRKPPKRNGEGKNVRGGDKIWKLLNSFENAEMFLKSELNLRIKKEFVKMRNRQFEYAMVHEYRCKFGKKSGYIACQYVLRVLYASSSQSVQVEINENAEHIHQPDPLYGQDVMVNYRWSIKMNE